MEEIDIEKYLQSILLKFRIGMSLLRDGKEIPAHEKLQGVSDNISALLNKIVNDRIESHADSFLDKTDSDKIESNTN